MTPRRMRVFAGPNGSGKTTIFKGILDKKQVPLGVYVNADEIEISLLSKGYLNFSSFQLQINTDQIQSFFKSSTFSPIKRNEPELWRRLDIKANVLHVSTSIDSYLSADIAEFIRQRLLFHGVSFTYETVMSHHGKIDFFLKAIQNGYRVYLYYVATEDPEINVSRVKVRVAQEGHAVPPDVVRARYYKSLKNLKSAVISTSRAYIFDNSQKQANLIAEITDGSDVRLNEAVDIPNWVAQYLFDEYLAD